MEDEMAMAEPPRPKLNFYVWVVQSMGPAIHVLIVVALVSWLLFSILHHRGRGSTVPPAMLLLTFFPCVIGLLLSLNAAIEWLLVVAMGTQLTASSQGELLSRAFLAFPISALCSLPLLIGGIASLYGSVTTESLASQKVRFVDDREH